MSHKANYQVITVTHQDLKINDIANFTFPIVKTS